MHFHYPSFVAGFLLALATPIIDIMAVSILTRRKRFWRCPKCGKRMVKRGYGQVCFCCDMYATDDLGGFLYHWNGGPAAEAYKEVNPRD